jgi:pimeloyl-ACP methyl ester carboxylesterase
MRSKIGTWALVSGSLDQTILTRAERLVMPTARAAPPLTHDAFRQRQKSVELEGLSHKKLRVAYTDLGKGEPVILLHGIPTWSFLYNEVIPLLAETARVIAPDFLGHGYSDKRDFFDRSLLAQTDMVIRLMDHLGIERRLSATTQAAALR